MCWEEVANPQPASSTSRPLRLPHRRRRPQFTSSKYWYLSDSNMPLECGALAPLSPLIVHRFCHGDRPFHANIRIDVIELREAAEEPETGGGNGFAERGHVVPVLEIVNRIAVDKSHHAAVDDFRRVDEAGGFEIGNGALEHLLIAHFPNTVSFVRGDLGH